MCSVLDGRCSDEPNGALAVARAMSRLAVLRSVMSDIASQLQVKTPLHVHAPAKINHPEM